MGSEKGFFVRVSGDGALISKVVKDLNEVMGIAAMAFVNFNYPACVFSENEQKEYNELYDLIFDRDNWTELYFQEEIGECCYLEIAGLSDASNFDFKESQK